MPSAALALKENRLGALSTSTSGNDEHTPPSLGDSEVTAVQHSPTEVVKPEVAQRPNHDPEISSTVGSEQAGDVLDNDPSTGSNKLVCKSGELEEESAASAGEAGSSSGDGYVLAGESSDESIETDGGFPVVKL